MLSSTFEQGLAFLVSTSSPLYLSTVSSTSSALYAFGLDGQEGGHLNQEAEHRKLDLLSI